MTNDPPAAESPARGLTITVDHRERASGLADLLLELWPAVAVATLTVGDVQIGPRVRVERKTIADLVASIRDGRLYRQLYALCGECPRPLLVIEGATSVSAAGLDAESLRGVLLSVAVGYRVPMLRTLSTHETCVYLTRIASREEARLARRKRPARPPPGPLAVLAAVPGVGEERAQALLERFGSVREVFVAPAEALAEVPGIGPRTARRIEWIGRDGPA